MASNPPPPNEGEQQQYPPAGMLCIYVAVIYCVFDGVQFVQ